MEQKDKTLEAEQSIPKDNDFINQTAPLQPQSTTEAGEEYWRELVEQTKQINYELLKENAQLKGKINFDQCMYDFEQIANKTDREELLSLRKEFCETQTKYKQLVAALNSISPNVDSKVGRHRLEAEHFPACLQPYGELLNNRFAMLWERIWSQERQFAEWESRCKECCGNKEA